VSAYNYIEAEGVALLPMAQRFPVDDPPTIGKIQQLAALMREGVCLPPIVVIRHKHADLYRVINGVHRWCAASILGHQMIPARTML
jgi:ParB-like chromosome segregation protein Spo0J